MQCILAAFGNGRVAVRKATCPLLVAPPHGFNVATRLKSNTKIIWWSKSLVVCRK